jgi:hypothetical protein
MTIPIRITQAELREFSELQRELAWKEQSLEGMKSTLMVLLREGAEIEPGRFDARLATRIGRAVPWKQLFVERLGQATADSLKREFKTHVYYEVEVLEHAVPPLWLGSSEDDGAQG